MSPVPRVHPPTPSAVRRLPAVLLAIVSAVSTAQTPQRFTLRGDDVALWNIAGVMQVQGSSGTSVEVEVTRRGPDAGKLTIETGPLRGR